MWLKAIEKFFSFLRKNTCNILLNCETFEIPSTAKLNSAKMSFFKVPNDQIMYMQPKLPLWIIRIYKNHKLKFLYENSDRSYFLIVSCNKIFSLVNCFGTTHMHSIHEHQFDQFASIIEFFSILFCNVRIGRRIDTCLLYTSPSPRDS